MGPDGMILVFWMLRCVSCFVFQKLMFYLFYFYFTILYWFCHTSTWIRHGCTHVPDPEPASHLPRTPSLQVIILLLLFVLFYCFIKFSDLYFRAAPPLSNIQGSPQVELLSQEPGWHRFFGLITVHDESAGNCQIFFSHWILWKSWLIGKDPDTGKEWSQEKAWQRMCRFEQTLGDGEGQGSLVCCSP